MVELIWSAGKVLAADVIRPTRTIISVRRSMYLSERDVRNIASYTRIRLNDTEVASMTTDLNNIIESLKPITEYELDGALCDLIEILPKMKKAGH